ncbi:hypothetical protein G3Z74_004943, partial [Escherichia coli]|nr:hypothetical protein [Escherichia coli]
MYITIPPPITTAPTAAPTNIPGGPPTQGKITKARSPQGLTPDSSCPWLL